MDILHKFGKVHILNFGMGQRFCVEIVGIYRLNMFNNNRMGQESRELKLMFVAFKLGMILFPRSMRCLYINIFIIRWIAQIAH